MTKKKIFIVFIMLAMVLTLAGCGGKDSKKSDEELEDYLVPIDNYVKGIEQGDTKKLANVFPEFMGVTEDDYQDIIDDIQDDYGDDIKISYEVKDKEKYDKDELEIIQKYIEKLFDEECEVSEGYEVEIELTMKYEDESDTDTDTMYVYKIDGEWKMLLISPSSAESYID